VDLTPTVRRAQRVVPDAVLAVGSGDFESVELKIRSYKQWI